MSIKKKINFIFFYSFYRPGPGPAPFSLKGGSGEEIKSRAGPTLSLKDASWSDDF